MLSEQRVYKHGLPFSTGLDRVINKLQARVDGKKAALLIIDGGLGEGKTTLLVHILDYINKINGLAPIEIGGPQFATGGIDFLKKIRVCYDKKFPCVGYDEAGDFSRRGSLTNFNAMLNRTFETFRAFKCIVVLALPAFNILDNEIFDKNIPRLGLHLKNRSSKQGNYYGYSLYRLQLLRYRMTKLNIKNYAYTTVRPNFYGHFLDLEPGRSKQLDRLTTRNKLEILRKSEVKIEGLMNSAELATKLWKSVGWVYVALRNLKIPPTRKIATVKYYDINVLNVLGEHLDTITDKGHETRGPRSKGEM